jgi:hypothetical protein
MPEAKAADGVAYAAPDVGGTFISHDDFTRDGPLWMTLNYVVENKGVDAVIYMWTRPFHFFFSDGPEDRTAVVMENNVVFDQGSKRLYTDIYSWYLDVMKDGPSFPFSSLCYGRRDEQFITSAQIRRSLGWRHDPFSATPAAAEEGAGAGAGAGVGASRPRLPSDLEPETESIFQDILLVGRWLQKNPKIKMWSPAVERQMRKEGLDDDLHIAMALLALRS